MPLSAVLWYSVKHLLPALAKRIGIVLRLQVVRRAVIVGLGREREREQDQVAAWLEEAAHLLAPFRPARGRDGDEESRGYEDGCL